MNQDEQQSTILLSQPVDWEKTEVQGLETPSEQILPPPAPSRLGYYLAGLLAIVAVLIWVSVLM